MPVNARKIADLKDDILSKIGDKFSEFKFYILAELKQQLKIEVAEAFKQFWCLNNMLRFVRTK